jgi:hypothetical protein
VAAGPVAVDHAGAIGRRVGRGTGSGVSINKHIEVDHAAVLCWAMMVVFLAGHSRNGLCSPARADQPAQLVHIFGGSISRCMSSARQPWRSGPSQVSA